MLSSSAKTAVINVKVDTALKKQAVKLAEQIGVPLSLVVQGGLRQFIAKQGISFFSYQPYHSAVKRVAPKGAPALVPNAYLRQAIKEARRERAKGNHYTFDSVDQALKFLNSQRQVARV